MNHRENALKLRVHDLQEKVAVQKLTFDRLLYDLGMTESLGCAFAWELGADSVKWVHSTVSWADKLVCYECAPDLVEIQQNFERALVAGEEFQKARKWLRDRMRADATFRKTAIEAAGKNPDMVMETPFGSYSVRTLAET